MTSENAARLAELRRAHGFSQEELAEKLNISRQAISKWERAEASPDTDNLIALAKLYGISLDELLGLNITRDTAEPAGEDAATYTVPDVVEDEVPQQAPAVDSEAAPSGEGAPHRHVRGGRISYPALITLVFLLMGFLGGWWHPGWIIFLTVPLVYLPERERTPLRLLSNPVVVTIIFLLLGFVGGWWHPGWLVFVAMPLLRALDG